MKAPKQRRFFIPTNLTLHPKLKEDAVRRAEELGYPSLSGFIADLLRSELEKVKIAAAVAAVASNPPPRPSTNKKGKVQ